MEETLCLPTSVETGNVLYSDRNQTVRHVVARFRGFSKEYFVSDHGERSALVAIKGDCILLTRQYRLIPDEVTLEIPGGRVNADEKPEAAAVRECYEETGVRCSDLTPLIRFHSGMDVLLNHTHVFWSLSCTETHAENVDSYVWLPLRTAVDMALRTAISDVLSITAILSAQYRTEHGRGP